MSTTKKNILKIFNELKPLKPIIPAKHHTTEVQKKKASITSAKPFKAVVFDIYGTLIISASGDIGQQKLQKDSFVQSFSHSGLNFNPTFAAQDAQKLEAILTSEYRSIIVAFHKKAKQKGIEHPEVNIKTVWKKLLDVLIKKLIVVKNKASLNRSDAFISTLATKVECTVNPTYPQPGFKELIKALEQKKSTLALGIVSNAQFYTPLLLSHFLATQVSKSSLLYSLFQKRLCYYSYQLKRTKPDIYAFIKLKQKLHRKNIAAHETLYIGNDMLKDMYPAAKVGFATGLFAGDKRSLRLRQRDKRTKNLQVDFVFHHLKEILSLI